MEITFDWRIAASAFAFLLGMVILSCYAWMEGYGSLNRAKKCLEDGRKLHDETHRIFQDARNDLAAAQSLKRTCDDFIEDNATIQLDLFLYAEKAYTFQRENNDSK